ncbi:helix-turn-helix transcriptional regulator [Chroococcidiopsidales cyanobacterium LEGE 13417]|nr:helix-turn-helix transcriptional regulator [Chroococcidiopsidales cyanobacterium LEGE 13417]
MTITISQQALNDLFQETVERYLRSASLTQHPDPEDPLDVMYKYPQPLGQGYWREIKLRQGLELTIGDLQLRDRMVTKHPEQERQDIQYHFHFSGRHEDRRASIGSGEYGLFGIGIDPHRTCDCSDRQPYLEAIVHIKPEVLYSFASNQAGELPPALQPWIGQLDREHYCRRGNASLAMQRVARQIVQCPYQGIAKRLYLESKALELMTMLVVEEIEIWEGRNESYSLKPDVVERVHHAREILLRRLDNPPSLIALAQQVGLNSRALKEGFRTCFGKPAFAYLHHYRLEQARQLLETKEMKVAEVAAAVGFNNQSYFAEAFRKKFGFNPKAYQMQRKKFF